MFNWNKFPYSNMQQLNLSWIISLVQEATEIVNSLLGRVETNENNITENQEKININSSNIDAMKNVTGSDATIFYNMLNYGLKGDGVTNDSTTLNTFLSDIGLNKKVTLKFPKPDEYYRFGEDVTFSDNITLVIDNGALFTPENGVTINGNNAIIDSGLWKIFDDSLGGIINYTFKPIEIPVEWFGGRGEKYGDDTEAIQFACDSVSQGSVIVFGQHRARGSLTLDKHLVFRGRSFVNGNYSGSAKNSQIYFDSSQEICISTTKNLSIEYMVISALGGTTETCVGVGVELNGGSLSLNHATLEGFETGFTQYQGHYSKIKDSYIGFCNQCMILDNCYNMAISSTTLQPFIKGIVANNFSSLTIMASSIERFTLSGIDLKTSSRVNLNGTYFEGYQDSSGTGECINLDSDCTINSIGCHIYLSRCAYFVNAINSENIRVFSRNNYFVAPQALETVRYYYIKADQEDNDVDISGDNWDLLGGENVLYCNLLASSHNGVGNYKITMPVNHPLQRQTLYSLPLMTTASNAIDSTPLLGTIYNAKNNGSGTNGDPLGLRVTPYGYKNYSCIYQGNGQFEKIGIRLENQAESTATDVAQLVNDFNSLLSKLKSNGVMI